MRWFTSDLHFFHKNVIKYCKRPFSSVEEMNEKLIELWNKQVSSKDLVYILGDFSFGNYEDTIKIVKRLNGHKILIRGNHDYRFTARDLVEMGFKDVRDYDHIRIGNKYVLITHYQYRAGHLKQIWYSVKHFFIKRERRKYFDYYPVDCGKWHLHGHNHSGPKINGRQINVCVDVNNFKPISEIEIEKIINGSK